MGKISNRLPYLALLCVCIIWGTTYYFLLIGVKTFPPFLFSAIRMFLAGGILLLFQWSRGQFHVEKNQLFQHMILGVLLIAIGNGVLGWSERYIPSGLTALIGSTVPIAIVFFHYIMRLEKKLPNRWVTFGLVSGTLGIILLFRDNLEDFAKPYYLGGMLIALLSSLSWAAGSVYIKVKAIDGDPLSHAGLHMVFGGVFLGFLSVFLDDYRELTQVTTESLLALLYLILVGSVFTYSCYVYALKKLPVGLVAIYAYINPIVALLMGYYLLQEKVTSLTGVALVFLLIAIYFINKGHNKKTP